MNEGYATYITEYGAARLAHAALSGETVDFAQMAVGDGGGTVPPADPKRTGLVKEVFRAPLNRVVIADGAENIIRTELIILPQAGGFWIREAALYDSAGGCLAVANMPPSYKPALAEGAGRLQAVNLWIAVNSTASVELTADLSVVLATTDEVNQARDDAADYTDRMAEQVTDALTEAYKNAIAAAVKQALSDAWESENPVGTVRFFNQNVNPNQRWPQSKWVYTGENRSIRVAAASGSNVGGAGGSDTVSIQQANLPNVQLDVSGKTSEQDAVDIRTTEAGDHQHGTFGEAANIGNWPYGYYDAEHVYLGTSKSDADNALMNSTPDGAHYHKVTVPAHSHSVTGKTAVLGQGQDVSIVESHILLMCWARVA